MFILFISSRDVELAEFPCNAVMECEKCYRYCISHVINGHRKVTMVDFISGNKNPVPSAISARASSVCQFVHSVAR